MLDALGIEGMEAGLPPPVLTGGMDEGTLPADAALGNEGGRLVGLPVETDDGIPPPFDAAEIPVVLESILPLGGKLLKLGSLPIVLLAAVEFICLLPWPGKLEGFPVETEDGIPPLLEEEETPSELEVLPPDGGKLAKLGRRSAVLLRAVSLI